MATTHNYAGCQVAVCQKCDSYADGYTAGKDKAFSEITGRAVQWPPPGINVVAAHATPSGLRSGPWWGLTMQVDLEASTPRPHAG